MLLSRVSEVNEVSCWQSYIGILNDIQTFKVEKRQSKLLIFARKYCLPPSPAVSTTHDMWICGRKNRLQVNSPNFFFVRT